MLHKVRCVCHNNNKQYFSWDMWQMYTCISLDSVTSPYVWANRSIQDPQLSPWSGRTSRVPEWGHRLPRPIVCISFQHSADSVKRKVRNQEHYLLDFMEPTLVSFGGGMTVRDFFPRLSPLVPVKGKPNSSDWNVSVVHPTDLESWGQWGKVPFFLFFFFENDWASLMWWLHGRTWVTHRESLREPKWRGFWLVQIILRKVNVWPHRYLSD